MGYGSRSLELLQMYYEGKFPTMSENGHAGDSEITTVGSEVRPPEGCGDELGGPRDGAHSGVDVVSVIGVRVSNQIWISYRVRVSNSLRVGNRAKASFSFGVNTNLFWFRKQS